MRIHGILGCLTALLFLGCGSATAPSPPEAVALAAVLTDVPVRSGQETNIVITATNTGPGPVEVAFGCSTLGYRITASDGRIVAPVGDQPDCAITLADVLEPGRSFSASHHWAAIEGYGAVGGSGDPLAPGEYRLTPIFHADPVTVEGEPISFTVVGAGGGTS